MWLFTRIRPIAHKGVAYDAQARHSRRETIAMKLEDQLRGAIRLKQLKTEEAYVGWYRRFVRWHGKKHPAEMGAPEVEAFLTHFAVNLSLGAVSQNQALNALVFLYKEVLRKELGDITAKRARQSKSLPVVLTMDEVTGLLKGAAGDADWSANSSTAAAFASPRHSPCGSRMWTSTAASLTCVQLKGTRTAP
jgi:hypothetical protein